jgi:dienelactone hydrolase
MIHPRYSVFLFSAALLLASAACVEYPHDGSDHPTDTDKTLPPFEDFVSPAVPVSRSVIEQEDGYSVEEVRFNSVTVRYWRPDGPGPHPAILMLPGIWGDRYLEDFAETFVKKGFVCLLFPSHRYLEQIRRVSPMKMESLADLIQKQVEESNRLYDWLSTEPEVDPDRSGILGMSIGAILASLLTESNPNVHAAAYVLGGGNLPDIMSSPQGYVKRRVRERIMAENGLSAEEFRRSSEKLLKKVDPLTYAGRLDARRIIMVNGRFDHVIPYQDAEALWSALGKPDWLVIPSGHYTASMFLGYIRKRVTEHFLEQLNPG